MNSAQRAFKKLTIILITLSIIGVIVYVIFKPDTPKCSNGILDVGEEQVDCGGFCAKVCPIPGRPAGVKDIKINWTQFVEDGRNNYDFVTSITNQNTSWGVASVDYIFTYYDKSGEELGTREGTTSISPRGDYTDVSLKYLIEDNVESNIAIDRVDLDLSNFIWKEVSGKDDIADEDDYANLNENIVQILDKNFEMNPNLKMYVVTGKTKNNSVYDFVRVGINTVLFGTDGKVVAVGQTEQLTMIAGDGWGFQIMFPNLKGKLSDVAKVDIRAETDVFDKNNFMRDYRATQLYE
ncbi:MAG: hypothetical protein PHX30_05335 [Candidatus Pacebacteria bacterium]|nr:hypothetical protein [Candidatus Paceibacterota bacterium]